MAVLSFIDRDRPAVAKAQAEIQKAVAAFLAELGAELARVARGAATKLAKAEEDDDHPVTSSADSADWTPLRTSLQPHLEAVAKDGAAEALDQVGAGVEELLELANKRAIAWAEEHSAELVTRVSETTRERVRAIVANALEQGLANSDLADEIAESEWFSDARAERIARTETAFADVRGNLEGWQASGVVAGKEWKTGAGCCEACDELDGEVVGLDEEFPGDGGDGPPAHPNCRCDVLPVLKEDDAEEAA